MHDEAAARDFRSPSEWPNNLGPVQTEYGIDYWPQKYCRGRSREIMRTWEHFEGELPVYYRVGLSMGWNRFSFLMDYYYYYCYK